MDKKRERAQDDQATQEQMDRTNDVANRLEEEKIRLEKIREERDRLAKEKREK